jgi:DNA gyrase subunit A
MISDRTGLDAMTRDVLDLMHDLGLAPDATFRKSSRIVADLYSKHGVPPRYGYDVICALAAPWLMQLEFVDFHGNMGSPDPNDEPAAARYTEARLSRVGAMAVAAERGEFPPLPIGLINGDLAFGGTAPPFDGDRIARALTAAGSETASDAELVEMIGPPAFPTGCDVDGDVAALAAGEATTLRLSATVVLETDDRESRLVVSRFPFGSSADVAGQTLAARVDRARRRGLRSEHPELHDLLEIPLRDVRNESIDLPGRLVCVLLRGADPELCRERILETWPVTVDLAVQLPAPLPALIRQFADDPAAQRNAMAALLAS